MGQLPQADWTKREGLKQLTAALGPDNLRWVGGAVRDTLLGVPVKDIDGATPLLPDEVMTRCKEAGIRIVPTGLEHGTLTAVLSEGPVEITTLRRDVSTDGRRATVTFATEWQEDASRRDFTINALYTHPETLEVSDYFGGLEDLEARTVRFIGDARERIREDHLRILRYYRFQARFGAELDEEAEEACTELAGTLKGLSRERIAMELLNLLGLPDPTATIARMRERGVLPVILPEAQACHIRALESLIEAEQRNNVEPSSIRRLAALLPPSPEVAVGVAARLRLSRAQRGQLSSAASRVAEDARNPRLLAYSEGMQSAEDRLLLAGADLAPLANWTPPQFPLRGGQIVARGVKAGPQVAQIMQTIERKWAEEGFPNKARIEELLSSELANLKPDPSA
ncbi:CCA tRNA nucleotidyltransferase [Altererythrobacter lutimaris]|uniref:CCA tRNA nucleotidyltransferase n=1 Tax=Altererythrobacter lutimaris TaxID=2743979 RepID=A0A850HA73_9SPHN|nr:CCA tRNA nucleotidyltransferase [Altererythrobacter lutimaris]NVE94619.1 CCA tRNA nucleotidyltransferase [Altererythrobacter lutimaris]